MQSDPAAYSARLPRHPVVDAQRVVVEVMAAAQSFPVAMLDFSRKGMRFASSAQWTDGTSVQVHLRLGDSPHLQWAFAGTIRWVQSLDDGGASYGCEFAETVSYEQLGELLLHGILSPD